MRFAGCPCIRRSAKIELRPTRGAGSKPSLLETALARSCIAGSSLRAAGAEIAYIHTSGHASAADLRAFATAIRPKMVVPVHGVRWDEESRGFGAVHRLEDGEAMMIP